jgi:hypothetical protein
MLREDFATEGRRASDGSFWELFGERYPVNPMFVVEPWAMEMIRLWRLFQGGTGVGYLPRAGGTLDQPYILLDAFNVMSLAEEELRPKR